MTNLEIVANEVIERELMTKEQVEESIEKTGFLPFMTYMEWKHIGYQVKAGSKAIIKTRLWKKVKGKKDEDGEEEQSLIKKFVLVNASLFGADQVEKIA